MLQGNIAYNKLDLDNSITNDDLAGGIAYDKLNLTGSITNDDLAGGIAFSKLELTGSITNDDLAGGIDDSKLNQITTANKVAGTAIELETNSGLEASSGLQLKLDGTTLQ